MRGRRAALLSSEIREQSGIKNSAANSISPGARAISPGFPGQAGRGGGDCVCGGEVKASFVNFVFVEENIRCYLCLPPASLGFFPSLCCHVRRTPTHSSIPTPVSRSLTQSMGLDAHTRIHSHHTREILTSNTQSLAGAHPPNADTRACAHTYAH